MDSLGCGDDLSEILSSVESSIGRIGGLESCRRAKNKDLRDISAEMRDRTTLSDDSSRDRGNKSRRSSVAGAARTLSWANTEDGLSDDESSMSRGIKLHSDFLTTLDAYNSPNSMSRNKSFSFIESFAPENTSVEDESLGEKVEGGGSFVQNLSAMLRGPEAVDDASSRSERNTDKKEEQPTTADPDAPASMDSTTKNFVAEHRIFVRAILSLLSERDQFAIEAANANDPQTIKSGSLRKGSHLMRGVWKVKYVEVRRGLFTYYEDSAAMNEIGGKDNAGDNNGLIKGPDPFSQKRKSLPLRAGFCTCRAVKVLPKNSPASRIHHLLPNSFIFELTAEGGTKRLWMTSSREERQAWIRAIHDAMIGGSVTQSDTHLDYQLVEEGLGIPPNSPYRKDLEMYARVRLPLQTASNYEQYSSVLKELFGKNLMIPVQWVKEQVEGNLKNAPENEYGAFVESSLNDGIGQLWRDILRDSVSINGVVYKGDEGHGPEKIIGALARHIIDFERSLQSKKPKKKRGSATESRAISFARDILLAANRTRSGGDSYYCMDNLCSNSELVCLCPLSLEAEPLQIIVSDASKGVITNDNYNSHDSSEWEKDYSGWVKMKNNLTKRWSKRYCVLSEGGVLSYYEKNKPRPLGLRGQIVINRDTAMNTSEMEENVYIIAILPRDKLKERHFRFENKSNFLMWRNAFQKAIDGKKQGSGLCNNEVISSPSSGYNEELPECLTSSPTSLSSTEHFKSSSMFNTFPIVLPSRKKKSRLNSSTISINVKASSFYRICTTDPEGIDENDTWATLQTDFLQSFVIKGHKMKRGEEIVRLRVLEGLQNPQMFATEFGNEE